MTPADVQTPCNAVCVVSGCAIIRPPRDGGIRYRGLTQDVHVLPVDYEIEYICRGSRIIVGPKVRKCLPNGTWTDLNQLSRCLLLCPRVWTSLENGRVSPRPLGPPVEGTVLHYSCLPGFVLMGRNSSHCNKMGKWDTPKPVCLCECPASLWTPGRGCGEGARSEGARSEGGGLRGLGLRGGGLRGGGLRGAV
uniref:Gamma-aminobutyric acid (GABA) B receptor, 1b n=1 Tax=Salarias fasciatus TaxID=181472 RepID=A0A672FKU6_SALFA